MDAVTNCDRIFGLFKVAVCDLKGFPVDYERDFNAIQAWRSAQKPGFFEKAMLRFCTMQSQITTECTPGRLSQIAMTSCSDGSAVVPTIGETGVLADGMWNMRAMNWLTRGRGGIR